MASYCNCCTQGDTTKVVVHIGKPIPPSMSRGMTPFPTPPPLPSQFHKFDLQPMEEDTKVNKVSIAIMLPEAPKKSDNKK